MEAGEAGLCTRKGAQTEAGPASPREGALTGPRTALTPAGGARAHAGGEGSPARQGRTAAPSPARLTGPSQYLLAAERSSGDAGATLRRGQDRQEAASGPSRQTTESDLENRERDSSPFSRQLRGLGVEMALAGLIFFPEFVFPLIFQAF